MKQLDLKDKKILTLLSYNSRLRLHEIAKQVKLSKNSIKYRIERLQKVGIIKKFVPYVNYDALKKNTYDIFIKVKVRKEQEKELLNFFKESKNVLWAATLFGEWDIFVQAVAKNKENFYHQFMDSITNKFGHMIDDYEIKINTKRLKIDHGIPEFKSLIKKELPKVKRNYKDIKLDNKDYKLIHALSLNARASFIELARITGESSETTRNRFNKLIKHNIIEGFSIFIDPLKLGRINFLTFFRLHDFSSEKEKEFTTYLESKDNVGLALKNGNFPEIYLLTTAKNNYEIETFIKETQDKFFSIIKKTTNITITEEIKLVMFPEGLIE